MQPTVDVTTFNSEAVIQSFSAEINVIIQQKLESPDTLADYQKFVSDVGKDYADRLRSKTEEAERYREEVVYLKNLLQETEAKAVTMASNMSDHITRIVSDRDRFYLGGRDLAVAFSNLQNRFVLVDQERQRLTKFAEDAKREVLGLRARMTQDSRLTEEKTRFLDQRIKTLTDEVQRFRREAEESRRAPTVNVSVNKELCELRLRCSTQQTEIEKLQRSLTLASSPKAPDVTTVPACPNGSACAMYKVGRCSFADWHATHPQSQGYATPAGSAHESSPAEAQDLMRNVLSKLASTSK